jgi:hypothetical protein
MKISAQAFSLQFPRFDAAYCFGAMATIESLSTGGWEHGELKPPKAIGLDGPSSRS